MSGADLDSMAADRTGEVDVGPVRRQRDEIEADLLIRLDLVQVDLVVAVRADGRNDLAAVLRLASTQPKMITIRLSRLVRRVDREQASTPGSPLSWN